MHTRASEVGIRLREVFKTRLTPNDQTSWNMNVFTTYALRWAPGDLNINIIHKNRYQVLLNWFYPYQTPMLKNADHVKKQHIFLYPCAVTIFFRNIWWDLIIENFCLEHYVEVATRMRYYTNCLKFKRTDQVTL